MKKIIFLISMFFVLVMSAQVKIGNNPTTVHSSSLLELESTTKGLLPPRMTSSQMNAIVTPAKGLYVHCTNCSPVGLHFFNGTAWTPVCDSSGGSSSSGGVSATMAFTTGTWIWGGPTVTRNIVINITNNSFSTVSWSNAKTDLVLSGGNSGLTVGSPTSATTSIASGSTGSITFPVTGVIGTMDEITATWTKLALTVVGTQAITPGSATFTNASNNAFVFSANASGVNVPGTLPIGTTVSVPYTSGVGKYEAYTSPDTPIASTHCNDGASDWTFAYSYPAGTFATSGNLTATLITKKAGVIKAWPAKQVTNIATIINNATWSPIVVNGNNLGSSFTVGINYGGDAIRGQLTTRAGAYDAAAVNTWISITASEYNNLASNVPGTIKAITSDTMMNTNGSAGLSLYSGTFANTGTNFTLVPANSYIIALRLKTHSEGANTGGFTGGQLKFNSINQGGIYTNYGNTLPGLYTGGSVTFNNNIYYVIKRPSTATTSSPTHVAFYDPSGFLGEFDYSTQSAATRLYTNGTNSTSLTASTATISEYRFYQVLCTPTKSW